MNALFDDSVLGALALIGYVGLMMLAVYGLIYAGLMIRDAWRDLMYSPWNWRNAGVLLGGAVLFTAASLLLLSLAATYLEVSL